MFNAQNPLVTDWPWEIMESLDNGWISSWVTDQVDGDCLIQQGIQEEQRHGREDENSVTGNETGLQHQKPSNQMNQVIKLRKKSYNYFKKLNYEVKETIGW